MVYFISDIDESIVKIGTTTNIKQRFESIKSTSFIDLKIVKVYEGNSDHENFLHKKFKSLRIRNELFKFGEEIKTFVKQNESIELPHTTKIPVKEEFGYFYNKMEEAFKDYKYPLDNIKKEFLILLNDEYLMKVLHILISLEKRDINNWGFEFTHPNRMAISTLLNIKPTRLSGIILRLKNKNFLTKECRLWYKVNKDIFNE